MPELCNQAVINVPALTGECSDVALVPGVSFSPFEYDVSSLGETEAARPANAAFRLPEGVIVSFQTLFRYSLLPAPSLANSSGFATSPKCQLGLWRRLLRKLEASKT